MLKITQQVSHLKRQPYHERSAGFKGFIGAHCVAHQRDNGHVFLGWHDINCVQARTLYLKACILCNPLGVHQFLGYNRHTCWQCIWISVRWCGDNIVQLWVAVGERVFPHHAWC